MLTKITLKQLGRRWEQFSYDQNNGKNKNDNDTNSIITNFIENFMFKNKITITNDDNDTNTTF